MIKRFYVIYNREGILVQKMETFGNPVDALPEGFSAVEVDSLDGVIFPVTESESPSKGSVAREKRDLLLQQSDWTQVPDSPVNTSLWATYRQSLRDVPTQQGFPDSIVWPEKPE